jgi:hypothetical protein
LVKAHVDIYLTADRFFIEGLKQAVVGNLTGLDEFLQTSVEAGRLAELVFQKTQPRDALRTLFTRQIARCLILHEVEGVVVPDRTKLMLAIHLHEEMAWEVCQEAIHVQSERTRDAMDDSEADEE